MISKILVNGKSTIPVHHNGESPTNITVAILANRSPIHDGGGGFNDPKWLYIEPSVIETFNVGIEYSFRIYKTDNRAASGVVRLPDLSTIEFTIPINEYEYIFQYTPTFTGQNYFIATAKYWIPGRCQILVEDIVQNGDYIFFTRRMIK